LNFIFPILLVLHYYKQNPAKMLLVTVGLFLTEVNISYELRILSKQINNIEPYMTEI